MTSGITLNGVTYKHKSDIKAKAKDILNRYPIGSDIPYNDMQFVISMLMLRKRKTIEEKTGTGIIQVRIALNQGKHRVFHFLRSDGTLTDFSYNKCLEPEDNGKYAKRAARWEIKDQIESFRTQNFNGICEITGETIVYEECHVDHIPPVTFDALFADFLKDEGRKIKEIEAENVGDFQMGTVFLDRELAIRWRQYHRDHAKLRIVSRKANLTLVEKIRGQYGD